MLAGSLCLLPFLLPYHQPPILSFFPEWLAAALGVAAALALLVGRGVTAVFLPAPARWLIAFAVLLAAQAASGGPAYLQFPPFAAPYVLYPLLVVWVGGQVTAALCLQRGGPVVGPGFLDRGL